MRVCAREELICLRIHGDFNNRRSRGLGDCKVNLINMTRFHLTRNQRILAECVDLFHVLKSLKHSGNPRQERCSSQDGVLRKSTHFVTHVMRAMLFSRFRVLEVLSLNH